jgi:threonine dehydrogenase-like Zn-dependent dehydrogenase
MSGIPLVQSAVQLVGAGELRLNEGKEVMMPGSFEILVRVEACGLCFSDLKLVKQFAGHARKGEVVGGLNGEVLKGIQSYVPGDKATVVGHEVVCRIVAVGKRVTKYKVGERCLVQTDYRELPTAGGSNAAFGYNFEGGLQEYVIVDERVAVDSQGERFLIPVGEEKTASAIALVEPWACVEDSYVNKERRGVTRGGRLLFVAEKAMKEEEWPSLPLEGEGMPGVVKSVAAGEVGGLEDEGWDDIVYFGADRAVIEVLNDKLAARGVMNVVLGGKKIGAKVKVGVGRVHYGMTRWVGTTGSDAGEGYRRVPERTEVRARERVIVIGAGGPMGQMHVIRNICAGVKGVMVAGTDVDDGRLAALERKAGGLAKERGVALKLINTAKEKIRDGYSYWALMAPVAALVEEAIGAAMPGGLINIFAGIPAGTKHEIDLDRYIEQGLYMFGTSGSVLEDMRMVLKKVESGALDTNMSLDAVSGMAGAIEGIRAIEERRLAGKIVVYPELKEVGLVTLSEMEKRYPTVAARMEGGRWGKEAEEEFLRVANDKLATNEHE